MIEDYIRSVHGSNGGEEGEWIAKDGTAGCSGESI